MEESCIKNQSSIPQVKNINIQVEQQAQKRRQMKIK